MARYDAHRELLTRCAAHVSADGDCPNCDGEGYLRARGYVADESAETLVDVIECATTRAARTARRLRLGHAEANAAERAVVRVCSCEDVAGLVAMARVVREAARACRRTRGASTYDAIAARGASEQLYTAAHALLELAQRAKARAAARAARRAA